MTPDSREDGYRHLSAWSPARQEWPDGGEPLHFGVVEPHAAERLTPSLGPSTPFSDVGVEPWPVVDKQLLHGARTQVARVGFGRLQQDIEQRQHVCTAVVSRRLDDLPRPSELVDLCSESRLTVT